MAELTQIADYRCHTGEGPLWHPDEERLYWVDIPNGRLFRYDPATGDHEQCYETDVIGGFTIQTDGSLLLFKDRGRIEAWHDGTTRTVVDELEAELDSRFNDVIADPQGRVFCGTMPTDDRLGRLYRLDTDGTITELFDGVDIPNGMGFTPNLTGMYFTETEADKIYRFQYNEESGELSDRDVFLDTTEERGSPDGMTVDADGYVWTAYWDGGCLVRYTPDGTEDRRIEFPARKVSCITFGGAEYEDAYVTTALGPGEGEAGTRAEEGEGAGMLFRFSPGAEGVPEFRSDVSV
jgi:D-xylono/L-arabinono-1,4-lactonase